MLVPSDRLRYLDEGHEVLNLRTDSSIGKSERLINSCDPFLKRNGANRKDSVEPSNGNTEPSRKYTSGRCRD